MYILVLIILITVLAGIVKHKYMNTKVINEELKEDVDENHVFFYDYELEGNSKKEEIDTLENVKKTLNKRKNPRYGEPIVFDIGKFKKLENLLTIIDFKVESGADISEEIILFHEIAEKKDFYDLDYFQHYWKGQGHEECIKNILLQDCILIENFNKQDLKYLIEALYSENSDYYLGMIALNTGYEQGYISDFVSWPDQYGFDFSISIDEKVDIIYEKKIAVKK